jgi:hypothetical protein
MAVFNRRNAMLGWAVWEIASKTARAKARRARRQVVPEEKPKRHLVRKVFAATAVAAGVAAVVGAKIVRRPAAS